MAKILIIADTHFGISNSSEYFLEQQRQFFNRLKVYMDNNNIKHMIHLGDLYDNRKTIDIRCLKSTTEFFTTPFNTPDYNIYILVGNHDTVYKTTNTPNTPRELLGWTNFNIIDEPTEIQINKTKFLLVPWINNENMEESLRQLQYSNADICCGHFDIYGWEIQKNHISTHGIQRELLTNYKNVYTGHYHNDSSVGNIYYIGTPYQLTWNDYNQRKKVLIYDTETYTHEEVYDLHQDTFIKITDFNNDNTNITDKIVKVYTNENTDRQRLQQWLDEQQPRAHKITIIEQTVINEIHQAPTQKSTQEVLQEYIDEMYNNDTDKGEIKDILTDLYEKSLKEVQK